MKPAPAIAVGLVFALSGCADREPAAWPEPAPPVAPPAYPYAPPPSVDAPYAAPSARAAGSRPFEQGRASFYSDRLAGHRTAAGERYDPRALTAAHRTLPFGTIVDVVRADGRHVSVRINDRGPYAAGRVIDLSKRAASELGIVRAGVADVALYVLWVPPGRG